MTGDFDLVETTVARVHAAMDAGRVTSRELVERYLDRIAAYDRGGPALNGVVTVNPDAVERAEALDREREQHGLVGPLHGIAVLVKDQAETAGLTTTFGSAAFTDYVPETDAMVVSRLRDAGAVVLAKTNLPDWATSAFAYSSARGRTRNPYAPERDPGGSSAGTAAGVAANLGTLGLGEDTGGSIRIPAAWCNLFGLRVTTGLVSRCGFSPLVPHQDTPGPMARTVRDLALLLDVIVGYDPADHWTGANALARVDGSYTGHAVDTGLEGARLGVLRQTFGTDADLDETPVTDAVEATMATMAAAGAELVDPVALPDLDAQLGATSMYVAAGRPALDDFLAARETAPVDSVATLYESGQYHELLDLFEAIAEREPDDDPDYWRTVAAQESLQRDLLGVFAAHDLDALLFPTVQVGPPTEDELRAGAYEAVRFNTVLAAQAGCPAMAVPAGLDDGVPVGVELLGKPYGEARLVELAAGYERAASPRRPPATTPAL
jgi:Asp-tRNA(Asn)/Glu-tRNA(Gln) amidotransferase A subunit family amidase